VRRCCWGYAEQVKPGLRVGWLDARRIDGEKWVPAGNEGESEGKGRRSDSIAERGRTGRGRDAGAEK